MPGSSRYPGTERYQGPDSEVTRWEPEQWRGYSGNSGITGGGTVQWELGLRGKAGAAENAPEAETEGMP